MHPVQLSGTQSPSPRYLALGCVLLCLSSCSSNPGYGVQQSVRAQQQIGTVARAPISLKKRQQRNTEWPQVRQIFEALVVLKRNKSNAACGHSGFARPGAPVIASCGVATARKSTTIPSLCRLA